MQTSSDIYTSTSRWRLVTIRTRLIFAFACMTLLLAAIATIGAWRLNDLTKGTAELTATHLRVSRLLGDWEGLTRSNLVRGLVLVETDDPEVQQLLTPALADVNRQVTKMLEEVQGLLDTAEARELFKVVEERRKQYIAIRLEVAGKSKVSDRTQLISSRMVPAADAYLESINHIADHYDKQVAHDFAQVQVRANQGRNLMIIICLAGVSLAILFSWGIINSVVKPIGEAVATTKRVKDGDLTLQATAGHRDEMGQLLLSLGEMSQNLCRLVQEVANGSHTVADTSAQIANGSIDLSQRTEEQARMLEETASSMEELTSTVRQNAQSAGQASHLAAEASSVASKGGQVVGEAINTMTAISESSKQIAEIIGIIDGIAFQTNILALNAAVEAARAGTEGRGFAVVATEVRSLAQRTAVAAKEIKSLIEQSTDQVNAGTSLVKAAGQTMNDIVVAVKQVSGLNAEIAAASHEQSQGIEQVNTAITHMEQVVQQNASLVEESTAATESLKEQAQVLLQMVSRFKLTAAEGGQAPAHSELAMEASSHASRAIPQFGHRGLLSRPS
jgi:methyl-accepting chemotaxis protein